MLGVIVFMSVWCKSKDGAVRAVYAPAGQFAGLGVGVANQSRVRTLVGGLIFALRGGVIGLVGFVMVEGVMEMKACLAVASIASLLGVARVAGVVCLSALAGRASVGALVSRASVTCVGALRASVGALPGRASRVALARVFCRYLVSSPDSIW